MTSVVIWNLRGHRISRGKLWRHAYLPSAWSGSMQDLPTRTRSTIWTGMCAFCLGKFELCTSWMCIIVHFRGRLFCAWMHLNGEWFSWKWAKFGPLSWRSLTHYTSTTLWASVWYTHVSRSSEIWWWKQSTLVLTTNKFVKCLCAWGPTTVNSPNLRGSWLSFIWHISKCL